MNKRISELPDFVGKDTALLCEKRGSEICLRSGINQAESVILIGLISLLVERGIIENEA